MISFRTKPLDLATEIDFGALGRLPRQDLALIKPHLLAASAPFAWHAVIRLSLNAIFDTFLHPKTIPDHPNKKSPHPKKFSNGGL